MIPTSQSRIESARHILMQVRCCARTVLNFLWIFGLTAALGQAFVNADDSMVQTHDRVRTICQNLRDSTVRIRSGSDVSSGVIVSGSGLVLTVAHGLKPDTGTITVMSPGSRSCVAKLVFVDQKADVALLEIQDTSPKESTWNAVPMSSIGECAAGQIVFASGYPARESDGMSAVVRLGRILVVARSGIKSSCILTSGDSGGPLVNGRGDLIGLHRQIGFGIESNEHIQWAAIHRTLENSTHWKEMIENRASGTETISKALIPSQRVINVLHKVTVEVHGNGADGKSAVHVLGTLLNDQYIATKLSEIGACENLSCQFSDGAKSIAIVAKADKTRDLAMLRLMNPYEAGSSITELYNERQEPGPTEGQLLFAATSVKNVSSVGLLSRVMHNEPSLPSRFGAVLRTDGGQIHLSELSPNGSALSAGLRSGDILTAVDGMNVSRLQEMSEQLALRQPGDWVSVDVARAKERLTFPAQLQHDPGQQFEKTEFLDGRSGRVSQRRSGFTAVLQHDIAIDPAACGGPLVDFDGCIIGINIARRAREATLAIPIRDVCEFAK